MPAASPRDAKNAAFCNVPGAPGLGALMSYSCCMLIRAPVCVRSGSRQFIFFNSGGEMAGRVLGIPIIYGTRSLLLRMVHVLFLHMQKSACFCRMQHSFHCMFSNVCPWEMVAAGGAFMMHNTVAL